MDILGIHNFHLFLASGLLLNFTPGPDMLYVTTRSLAQGRTAGVVSGLAIGAGSVVHLAATVMGLAAVLMYSSAAFTAIKLAGAAYLIFLGVKALVKPSPPERGGPPEPQSLSRIFRQGMLVNMLNPKVALFFLAFLPQFADPASGRFSLQILFLGSAFITTGTLVNCLVGLTMGSAGGYMRRWPAGRFRSRLSGFVYIALGLGVALAERR